MKKITFLLAMMLVTFTACHNEDFEEISLESKREKISYEVTPEDAVSCLGMFLSNTGTRASLNDVTIKTLMKSDFVPATRSSDAEDAPAVYLIDIPEGGCAVMGADKRLEPVYAIMDETKLSPEDLVATSTRTESTGEEDIQTFVTGLINDAVEADIMGIPIIKDTTELIPNPYPHDEEWIDTTILNQISPLLNTKWHQNAPFNNHYPIYSSGIRKYAGCGVIAAAQILYKNRKPNSINGIAFDWNLISQYEYDYSSTPSLSARMEIANYVHTIAQASNAELDNGILETGSPVNDMVSFFSQCGYTNVSLAAYSYSAVEAMLSNNHPVWMWGAYNYDNPAHAWVVDGCLEYKFDYWIRDYKEPPIMVGELPYDEYIYNTQYIDLVHCNYGWGGKCDGYYTSGIFDLRNELDIDNIDTSIGDFAGTGNYYNTYLEIIKYTN